MSNEDPIIKPTIEIETKGNSGVQAKVEKVDAQEGYDEAFEDVLNMLLSDPISYYIEKSDDNVSVVERSTGTVIYFTDMPREMNALNNAGLEKDTIYGSKPSL